MRTAIASLLVTGAILLAACSDDPGEVDHIDVSVPEATGPELVATGYGKAWFAVRGVLPIDQRSRKPGRTVYMRSAVEGLTAGEGGVWAALGDGSVARIDPDGRKAGRPVRVGPESFDADKAPIAAGEGAVWVAVEDSVVAVDPASRRPHPPIRVDGTVDSIVAGNGAVWVAVGIGTRRERRTGGLPPEKGTLVPRDRELVADGARDDRVLRIDPRTREVTADVKVPEIGDLALLGRALWASTAGGIQSLDPRTLRPLGKPIDVAEGQPTSIAAGRGAIWGTIARENLVVRADPKTRKVTDRWQIPSAAGPVSAEVGDLAVGDDAVWVGTVVGPRIGVIDPT
jgi:hypothetical protein